MSVDDGLVRRTLDVLQSTLAGSEWAPTEGGIITDAVVIVGWVDTTGEHGQSYLRCGSPWATEGLLTAALRDLTTTPHLRTRTDERTMPNAPRRPCWRSREGCHHLTPCPIHGDREPWADSTRRASLPAGWSTAIVPAILTRDPTCRCPGCPRCTPTGCSAASTEVDHAGDRLDHRTLRGLCHACHALRTRHGRA